ncbi:MAG: hypothetical protein ACE5D0_01450 [Fidelibacterota bacterium]
MILQIEIALEYTDQLFRTTVIPSLPVCRNEIQAWPHLTNIDGGGQADYRNGDKNVCTTFHFRSII